MKKNKKRINKSIFRRIKQIRRENRLSQEDFGDKVGVTGDYIGKLERGARMPSLGLILAISAVMGVDEAWLRRG